MSLETWKAEFYPIEASKVLVEDAVQHSLRKWRGLTKENLKKHGVKQDGNSIYDVFGSLRLNYGSCALCFHYECSVSDCPGCPLVSVLGTRCDICVNRDDEHIVSPYREFIWRNDPLPMIEALEKAAALEPDIR